MESRYSVDARALRVAMTAAGFDSYISFAKATGLSDRTVAAIAGGKNPTYPVMCKMASVLDLSAESAGKIFFNDNLRNA